MRVMDEDRSAAALDRIETALARLEQDAVALRKARGQQSADRDALAQLQTKHTALRGRVTESLAQLDAILAGPKT